jgi:hypothetical protein
VSLPLWASFLEQTSAGDGVPPGETLDLGLPDWMMATREVGLPAGGIVFWSRPWLELVLRWSGMSLSVLTTVRLGGLVPQSLDGVYRLRCEHREEALFGAMVASSAGSTKFMWILTLKIAWRFDGGVNFCSVYMRYSLSVISALVSPRGRLGVCDMFLVLEGFCCLPSTRLCGHDPLLLSGL